jgi:RNA polymerase sigma-70 factor, ECF subfamily
MDSNKEMDAIAVRDTLPLPAGTAALADEEIVSRVQAGEHALFEILMRRHNQRLYRAARAIVRDENEIEDVLQQTYMNAFSHLRQFEARSQFSTWLTRILINEASRRRRKLQRAPAGGSTVDAFEAQAAAPRPTEPTPEHRAYVSELRRVLEEAVDALPGTYRIVFMLRDIEGMSTSETALALGLADEAVKTRLHRGRAMIRRAVRERIGGVAADAFPFYAPRCDRVVSAVLAWIGRS